MESGELLKLNTDGQVAILTISRPEGKKVNVLTPQLMSELSQAMDEFEKDEAFRVVVITGEGPYTFVAGADVKAIAGIQSKEQAMDLARRGQEVLNKIERSEKPVICAINNICLGGGLELAMSCHIRVASDRAKFGQPEILLGILPGFGGTQRLSRICGTAKARELLLTGDQISAQDAFQIGLVNRVVPEGRLLKESVGLAKKIAANPQAAVRLIQRAVRDGSEKSLREGLNLEIELFGAVCETGDMKEGVNAFLEKRQPKFQHR
ncbi:MAG: enoyl-CoA hydratase [Omnitrophica bacterium RIFCSPLOWO2_12_FULL_50_11]|nr:MAG: enoyl-CoA hydratase [Omnitrophica bacterium RIFCSPLOWO2_12_FULL_50_11]